MRSTSFLPHLRHIKVNQTLVTDHAITLVATTTRKRAPCPLCRRWSKRTHSSYGCTIRDLPWAGDRSSSASGSTVSSVTIPAANDVSSPSACRIWPPFVAD